MNLVEPSVGPIMGARIPAEGGFRQKVLMRGHPNMGEQSLVFSIKSIDGSYQPPIIDKRVTKKNDWTVVFEINGMPESKDFDYRAGIHDRYLNNGVAPNVVLNGGYAGSLSTGSKNSDDIAFIFGSCRHPDTGKDQLKDDRCFTAMTRDHMSADLLIMCGDQIYGDHSIKGYPILFSKNKKLGRSHYLSHYQKYFARPSFKKVTSKIPTYMIFDDHEVKNNWSKGAFDRGEGKFKNPKILEDALYSYDTYQASLAPQNRQLAGKYYYEFSQGKYDFFVMDQRYERDVIPGKMVSSEQIDALEQFLFNGEDRIKFIVSPVPMFPDSSRRTWYNKFNPIDRIIDAHPEDRWEGYPKDRNLVLEICRRAMEEGANKNIFVLSGDVHCSSVYHLEHRSDPNFVLHNITSSAFNWSGYMPGLNDRHFDKHRRLLGSEDYKPVPLHEKVIVKHNYCRVESDGNELTVSFYNNNGGVIDDFGIALR